MRTLYPIFLLSAFGMTAAFLPKHQFEKESNLPPPACTLTVDAGPNQNFCSAPQTVNLNASIGGASFSVEWSPAAPVANPGSPNTTATISQTTTFEVTVTGPSTDENLVVNGDFNAGLSNFTSDYVPGTGGAFGLLSNEGEFAVAANAGDTHTNFAPCTDNTGGGNMLVVNGAGIANQEVWCQTVGISPNTDYAFSAWVTSVVGSSPAQLQFSVNGVIIGGVFSASPVTCQWNQFFEIWNSGGNTSVELCIVNQNTATSGNDFALDDISFSPVCEATDQVTFTITDINAGWTPPTDLCPLSPIIDLNTLLNPGATPGGVWTVDGVNTPFLDPLDLGPGAHTVTYTVIAAPCQESQTEIIIIDVLPDPGWGVPPVICSGTPPFDLDVLLFPSTLNTGNWTIDGFPAVFFDPADLGVGPHLVTYTVGAPPCTSELSQYIDVAPGADASWTPPGVRCADDPPLLLDDLLDPEATPGGTWTVNGVETDTFDPAVFGPGNYTVTYVAGFDPCTGTETNTLTVLATADADWTAPAGLCTGSSAFPLNDLLTDDATSGGNWTIDGAAAVDFDPANLGPGLYAVAYEVGTAPCAVSLVQNIEVLASANASWMSPDTLCTDSPPFSLDDLFTTNTTPGGAWTVAGDSAVQLNPAVLGAGDFLVTYSTGEPGCEDALSQTITILPAPNADWTLPEPLCASAAALVLDSLLTDEATPGGSWTIDGQPATVFDPDSLTSGLYELVYTVGDAPCTESLSQNLEILPAPVPDWTLPGTLCVTSLPFSLDDLFTPATTPGGVWLVAGDTLSLLDPGLLGAGPVAVTYTVGPPGCEAASTDTVTIAESPNVDWTAPGPFCATDAAVDLNDWLAAGASTGGEWTVDGVVASEFDPGALAPGSHTVAYSVFITSDCQDTLSQEVEIRAAPEVDFAFAADSICINEPVALNILDTLASEAVLHWDFGSATAATPLDSLAPVLTWSSAGIQEVSLWIAEQGCPSEVVTRSIVVIGPPPAPQVGCLDVTSASVEFSWPAVAGATEYSVEVLSGQTGVLSGTTFTLLGLQPGETVQIEVTATGECGSSTGAIGECNTLDCDPPEVVLEAVAPICLEAGAPPVTLVADFPGGEVIDAVMWGGPGLIDTATGVFDPVQVGPGTHVLNFTYQSNGCIGIDSLSIVVSVPPVAAFDAPDTICAGAVALIEFTGAATAGAVFNWDFAGGQVVSGSGAGPYEVTWPDGGARTVTLEIVDGPCTSLQAFRLVFVEEPIVVPAVDCESTFTSVFFSWSPPPGGEVFSVLPSTMPAPTGVGDSSVIFENLQPGDAALLALSFLSHGSCPDDTSEVHCTTAPCPDVGMALGSVPGFCLDSSAAPVQMEVSLTGDTLGGSGAWSGTGVNSEGLFFPPDAGVGAHTLVYTFTIAGVCTYTDSTVVNVFPVPTADFVVDDPLCVSDTAVISFTGMAADSATYNWEFDGGTIIGGSGAGPYALIWDAPGERVVVLEVVSAAGCASGPVTGLLTLEPTLPAPVVDCSATFSTIDVSWAADDQAAGYEVSWAEHTVVVDTTHFTITGLAPGESVDVTVAAISSNQCPDIPVTISCATVPCPQVSLEIDPIQPLCFDGADTIALGYQLSGGDDDGELSWSGPGLIAADPALAVVDQSWVGGQNPFVLTYQDDVCLYADTVEVVVYQRPTADFNLPPGICFGDTTTIEFAGNAGPDAQYSWGFGGGQVVSGSGAGPYQVSWATPGDKQVSLIVTENNCVSEPVTQTIQVDPPLSQLTIGCQASFDSLLFSWDAVANAAGYEFDVLQGYTGAWLSDTSYLLTGLPPGTPVSIQLTVLSANNCGDLLVDQSCVTIPCPEANLSIEAPTALCAGDSATLVFAFDNPAAGPFMLQLFDGTDTLAFNGVSDGDTYTFLPAATQTWTVLSAINATAAVCPVGLPEPFILTVNQPVTAGLPLEIPALCSDLDTLIDLNARLTGATGGGVWTEISGSPATSGAFDSVTGRFQTGGQAPGTYAFRYFVAAEAPCVGDTSEVSVTILASPVADAGIDQTLECVQPELEVGGAGTSLGDPFAYEWISLEGHVLEGADSPFLLVTQPGRYRLVVVNSDNQCAAEDLVEVTSDINFLNPYVSVSPISCFEADDGLLRIDSVTGGSPPLMYAVNGGPFSGQTLYSDLAPGLYDLAIRDAENCETRLTLQVADKGPVEVTLATDIEGDEPVIQLGDSVRLFALTNIPVGALDTVIWFPDSLQCGDCLEQGVQPFYTSTFSVTVIDEAGCRDSDELTLFVERRRAIYIPSAFSPNGDGTNDAFVVFAGQEVAEVRSLRVFNRWGELLFERTGFPPNSAAYGWDGTHRGQALNPGVFVYVAEIEMIDGKSELYQGEVLLVK